MTGLIDAWLYVSTAPFFWQSMFMTSACSIFIGALLYNGDAKLLAKGMFTLIPYVLLLLTVTIIRLSGVVILRPYQAYAGLATIISLSIFYVFGLVLGVFITKLAHWSNKNDFRQLCREI